MQNIKKREKKTEKLDGGITLIGLMITIVVMLILAGVAINLTLSQNGIFTTAQKAAQNYTEAQNQEMTGIDSFISAVDKVASGQVYYATDKVGNSIPVPVGFSPITTSDQGTKDTGFVIKNDTDGNEFVWVPATNYERVGWSREGWAYRQTLDTATGRISIVNTTYYWTETMPVDEQSSVNIYGGFYIGRYEAGVKDYTTRSETSDGTTTWTGYTGNKTKLVIQDDQEIWNFITRDRALIEATSLYNKIDNNATSKLCSSYAWDSALKFIETNNKTYPTNSTGGNYNTDSDGTGMLQLTGYHKVNNIYDMGGNAWEWTTELCSSTSHPYVSRGGTFDGKASGSPAARRVQNSTAGTSNIVSFRVTLYL